MILLRALGMFAAAWLLCLVVMGLGGCATTPSLVTVAAEEVHQP